MKPSSTLPLVVVVVTYQSAEVLPGCLEALLAVVPAGQVVVADNASSDGSAAVAEAAGVVVIRRETNDGFAAGVNAGVQAREAERYLLLNPDVTVNATALAALGRCLDEHPEAAAVGPFLRSPDGSPGNDGYYSRLPSLGQVVLFQTGLRKLAKRFPALRRRYQRHEGLSGVVAVDQVPGGCMLVPRAAFERVGLFDEGYLIWYEDVDWSERARKAGLTRWFCGEAEVLHLGGHSFERVPSVDKDLLGSQSMRRFLRLHRPVAGHAFGILLVLDRCVRLLAGDRRQREFLARWRSGDIRLPVART